MWRSRQVAAHFSRLKRAISPRISERFLTNCGPNTAWPTSQPIRTMMERSDPSHLRHSKKATMLEPRGAILRARNNNHLSAYLHPPAGTHWKFKENYHEGKSRFGHLGLSDAGVTHEGSGRHTYQGGHRALRRSDRHRTTLAKLYLWRRK